jgi:uncharacterized protein YegL
MPNDKLCEIAFLLDRSGSMESIRTDMIGGFKNFIDEQRKIPDPCVVTLYHFDTEFEVVYQEKPLAEVDALKLAPRGSTALYDAMGKAITMMGERLEAKPDAERPGKIIFMTITDGQENASREYNIQMVREKIKTQSEKYNWQFAFLGANIDSHAVAGNMGIQGAAVMDYIADSHGVARAYGIASSGTSDFRRGRGAGGQTVNSLNFTPEPEKDKK